MCHLQANCLVFSVPMAHLPRCYHIFMEPNPSAPCHSPLLALVQAKSSKVYQLFFFLCFLRTHACYREDQSCCQCKWVWNIGEDRRHCIVMVPIYQSPGLPLWMRSYAHYVVLYLNNVLSVYAYKALAAEINMPIDTQHIKCSRNVCNIGMWTVTR